MTEAARLEASRAPVDDEARALLGCGPEPEVNLDGSPRRQEDARRAHSFLCVSRTRARRSRAGVVGLNGGPTAAWASPGLLGPRRMEAKRRVEALSEPLERQGEVRSLSGSLWRLGPSTDEVTSRFEDILHRGKPGLRRRERVVPLQPAHCAAEEEGVMGELRAPVNQRRGRWNRPEDARAELRLEAERATLETTIPRRGRRPLT
jgi:hypothetical protein